MVGMGLGTAEGRKGRKAERQKGRTAERQNGRKAERQKGRTAERQKGRKGYICFPSGFIIFLSLCLSLLFGQPFKKLCSTLSGDRYFFLVAHQDFTTFCFVDFEDVFLVDKMRFVDPEKT